MEVNLIEEEVSKMTPPTEQDKEFESLRLSIATLLNEMKNISADMAELKAGFYERTILYQKHADILARLENLNRNMEIYIIPKIEKSIDVVDEKINKHGREYEEKLKDTKCYIDKKLSGVWWGIGVVTSILMILFVTHLLGKF